MRHDLKLAVRSSVGLTLTVLMHPDQQVTLTSIDHLTDAADSVTSLRLPMKLGRHGRRQHDHLRRSGSRAFVDLAADLNHSGQLPLGAIVLDEDTAAPSASRD